MNDSIELYDELHSMSREPLSIEEANAKGCNFYDNEPTRNAFQDFRECFQSFCDEQNCVEGEPFAQEAPSIRPFLDSHKATKRPSRRLKIGVKAPPVMSIARKPVAAVRQPIAKKIREVKISPKATVLRSVKDPAPVTAKAGTFQTFVQESNSEAFHDAVFFLPKDYEADFLKNKAEYVKRHGFRGKHDTLNKLVHFRSMMKASNWNAANNVEIVSFSGTVHKVANITFNFNSLDDCLSETKNIPFVNMLSSAPLK